MLAIDRKSHEPDRITQQELRHAAELQAAVWLAEKAAREYVQHLEARLTHGAEVEPGEMVFDRQLQMARSKRASGDG